MVKSLGRMLMVFSIATLFITGCTADQNNGGQSATEIPGEAEESSQPEQSGESLAEIMDGAEVLYPLVLESEPGLGEQLSPQGKITVVFDQPMNTASVEKAWMLTSSDGDDVNGSFSWLDDKTEVSFTPTNEFENGLQYELSITEEALSVEKVALEGGFEHIFYTQIPVQISQVFPEPDSVEVDSYTQITTIFNQPVVSLKIVEEQNTLVQPLEFDPPVSGSGEWVNTSVYVFQPDAPLKGASGYTVSVKEDLSPATGEQTVTLKEPYEWSFFTQVPEISYIEIGGDWLYPPENEISIPVSILPTMKVHFHQPMNKEGSWNYAQLIGPNQEIVPLRYSWDANGYVLEMKPREFLKLDGQEYMLNISADFPAANGGTLQEGMQVTFKTIEAPSIRSVYKNEYENVIVDFRTDMNADSFERRIVIDPPLENMYYYYQSWNDNLVIGGFSPSQSYTVTILAGTTDIFGNAINYDTTNKFNFDDLDPYFYLDLPGQPQYRVDGPQDAYYEYINIETVDIEVYRIERSQYLQRITVNNSSNPTGEPVWEDHLNVETPLNTKVVKRIDFTDNGESPLEPGYYLLCVNSPDVEHDGKYLTRRPFMVVSDSLNLKISDGNALVWQTNLTSGEPVADNDVEVWSRESGVVAKGKTNNDGVFLFDFEDSYFEEALYAYSTNVDHLGMTAQSYYSGVSAYDFGIWAEYYSDEDFDTLRTYIYTDKPLYRPGQTVYFKGVVRNDRDLNYTLPGEKLDKVVISVRNYEKEIYTTELSLNEFGSFDGEFELSVGTTLGSYFISARDPETDESIGSVDFSVAEYRKPEFLVDVSVEPNQVTLGDKFTATIESAYYSGGGLVDAPIYYSLHSSPYSFYPGGDFRKFNFTDVVNAYYGGASTEEFNREISEGHAFTDEEGKYEVEIPADSRSVTESQLIDLDVSVFDVAGNEVAAHTSVVAHSSKVYAGVDSVSYVGTAGEEQFFDLAAVNWDGEAVAGQTLTARVYKLEWYSVRKEDASGVLHWEYSKREIPATDSVTVVSDEDGLARISFVPEVGGTYFARVSTLDDRGRQSVSSAMMWVSSWEYIPWKQSDDRTFELVTNQDSYQPGEEAEILIASPYQGDAYALITLERGLIRSQEVILLEDNSTIYKVPITKDMAPTVYVSVLVVKGVDEFNPYPDFKMSMATLDVSTEKQQLTVNLEMDKEQAGPGDEVTYDVEVLDAEGEPAEAEVSLGLTDLSVLVLADSNAPSMLNYFYNQRALSVQTSASITKNVEAYNAELSETVTEGLTAGSGGGKGGGEYGVESVRQNFPDTPFWLPDAITDEDGKTSVTVTLPDNLTTWRMDTRAITKETEVGSNLVDIISTKPLLVRPQTPRFFVIGDELTIGTAVHNNSEDDLEVTVSIEASGVDVLDDVAQMVAIPAHQQVFVTWQVSVPMESERADFVFRAVSDEYSDASLPTLGTLDNQGIPVYRYEVPETVSTSGSLSDGGMRTETIQMPQTMDVQNGQLDITIEPSLLVGMQAGLDYLESYPYECNEQTVSRFLPNILTYQAMKEAGMEDAELEANLEREVNLAVQRLDSAQRSDGGWGWWPGSTQSNAMVSAYVMFGLWQAQEAGYDVDDEMIANGQDYLLYTIEDYSMDKDVYHSYKVNRMTFMVYVMSMMDQPVVSYAVQLADNWKYLSLESQAYLAITLHNINEEDSRIATLKNAIVDEVILSASGAHWEESSNDYYNWGTDTRSTAVILDAMIRLDPQNPITANAVRWLMRNRNNGHWASTQETAWTLLSLTNWMRVSGDLTADYEYAIKLNGEKLDSGAVDQTSLEEIRTLQVDVNEFMQEELNRLTVARTAGDGNLYYTADLDVYLPVDDVEALDQGVIVSRSYYQQDDLETAVTQANQGDILVAQITIVLPQSSHYLLVEDMLPAGMEAIDTSLNTSRSYYGDLGMSSERYWWRWYFDHTELRDEKVALTAEYLPAGTYTYTYLVRASFPGTYNVIPTVAQEFYFPDVYGRGDGSQFVILP
jgi:alpha-2-macroglobulin